jgi:hypothetical protein
MYLHTRVSFLYVSPQMALASNPPHATEFVGIVQRYQTGLISGEQVRLHRAIMTSFLRASRARGVC